MFINSHLADLGRVFVIISVSVLKTLVKTRLSWGRA